MTHRELSILEAERHDYFKQRGEIKDGMELLQKKNDAQAAIDELKGKRKELDANYIPIDFDAYSIEDKNLILNKAQQLQEEDQIWRISSLTAYVDNDTKILLLPVAESKRQTKIMDTLYKFTTVKDLLAQKVIIENSLCVEEKEVKRFEDKTQEELSEDMVSKRRK